MTTRKLKVWCEKCDGRGFGSYDPDAGPVGSCSVCCGSGFTFVDAVDLPDGRVVVVGKEAWKRAIDEMGRRAMPFQGAPPSLFDEMPEEEKDSHRCVDEARLVVALAALFTGKVYEAKAVGFFDCDPPDANCAALNDKSYPFCKGDFIAVGLKEVGK